ncbi:DegT/DnrJ/EryC1/StrS family aminotransferase [Bradyrhizobium sp. ma5]|uniref:DegT/DnrJ/EryC1/StrS family aminotransferase n=1 Tax=Bradyrhizobium sp. ma5 TaxID=3344828 RepID=UPI0035D473C7
MNITEPSFDEAEIALLRECLDSKWVTQGPLTERFERLIAEKHDVKHALACTSCTAALHLATMALKLGPGDEVIVPAFTWVTSAHSAEYVGAKPVFVDVDLSTYNIDPERLEAAITPRTKAIIAVHLFGLAAPMDEILAIARPRGIQVIEDAACAIGTTYKGRLVGAIGDIGCFSFHPRKAVTTGEGGAVTTNRDDLAARVRSQRNHGATGAPDPSIEPHGPWTMATFDNLGFNLRLSDIQAAVGVAQMGKLDRLLSERRRLGRRYSELLTEVNSIARPLGGDLDGHTYQSYVIRVLEGGRMRRNALMTALANQKIQTRPGTHAVHRLGYYANKYALKPEQFPNAALAEDTTITLPIFPGMTEDDQNQVVKILRAVG